MRGHFPNEVVQVVCAFMVPFLLVFGVSVVAHGHYTPGGGFTGGVIIGVGLLLVRLYAREDVAEAHFPPVWAIVTALLGVLGYLIIGVVPLLAGGSFLDYSAVGVFGLPPAEIRYLGILFVELAIGATVAGTVVLLFDALSGRRAQ